MSIPTCPEATVGLTRYACKIQPQACAENVRGKLRLLRPVQRRKVADRERSPRFGRSLLPTIDFRAGRSMQRHTFGRSESYFRLMQ